MLSFHSSFIDKRQNWSLKRNFMPFLSPYKQCQVLWSFSSLKRNKDIFYTKKNFKGYCNSRCTGAHNGKTEVFIFQRNKDQRNAIFTLYLRERNAIYCKCTIWYLKCSRNQNRVSAFIETSDKVICKITFCWWSSARSKRSNICHS